MEYKIKSNIFITFGSRFIRTQCMMNRHLNAVIFALAVLAAVTSSDAAAARFVDFSPARKIIEVDVHAIAGAAAVKQNYEACFPQIRELNVNSGYSLGAGARAVFGLREYLGFGTALDIMTGSYNIDMAVIGADHKSMSAVYIDNTTYSFNIPLFVSFRFNVAHSVRWNVDAGAYYAFGFSGTQHQRIYRADINGIGELVPGVVNISTDYYHSRDTFINGFNRGDIGLHMATSLNFGPHLTVGAQFQYGLKNAARRNGIINPSLHNYNFNATVGYRF